MFVVFLPNFREIPGVCFKVTSSNTLPQFFIQ
jgi:hypothetical protein